MRPQTASREGKIRMLIWIADLLGLLLCAQIVLFPARYFVNSGLVLYCLSGVLLAWAWRAVVIRGKPAGKTGGPFLRLMQISRVAESLLLSAYFFAAISWLNLLATYPQPRHLSTVVSVFIAAVGTGLCLKFVVYQDQSFVGSNVGKKHVRATTAWIVLMVFLAVPLVGGVALTEVRLTGPAVTPELAAPELALAWLCFCSVFLAAVLFRPWLLRISLSSAVLSFFVLLVVLGAAAALEAIWRHDWYLYSLTGLAFLGTTLGLWRLVCSICVSPQNAQTQS
jgi:hypothetical protein